MDQPAQPQPLLPVVLPELKNKYITMAMNAVAVCRCEPVTTTSTTTTTTTTFSPDMIEGLQIWYDATDSSTLTLSGTDVLQVRDKTTNANNSSTSGAKPFIMNDPLTGKQVINMDPSDSGLPLTTELVNTTFTMFLVYKIFIHSGSTVYVAGNVGHANFITTQTDNSIIGIGGAGTQTYQWDGSDDEMAIIVLRQDGTQQLFEYNGRQRIRTTGTAPAQPFYIGRIGSYNGGAWAGGEFAGFLYYDSFLSDGDTASVVNSLVQTHNINPTPYYKIIGFGDSHTVGVGADPQMGYIYQIADSLGKSVAVQGISGSLYQDISGTDVNSGYNRYGRNFVENPTNDRLYMMYGYNDIPNGGATVGRFTTQLTAMVVDLLAMGYPADRIYLGTIPRYYGDANSVLVQQYGDVVRTVCSTYGLHCAEVYQAIVDNGGDSLYYVDHIHFNNAGHTVIANAFLAS